MAKFLRDIIYSTVVPLMQAPGKYHMKQELFAPMILEINKDNPKSRN